MNRIKWAKEVSAWVEYRVSLTDHFYADGCTRVSAVLVAFFLCAIAHSKIPVVLDRDDYFKGAPNLPRQDKDEKYYITEASQNLECISKLIGKGALGTTSYSTKNYAIKKEYNNSLIRSKIETDFTQELERLYRNRDKKFNDEKEFKDFISDIAYNLLKNNVVTFGNFIDKFKILLDELDAGKVQPTYVGAIIHYHVAMTGKFFKDGNRRIALALETFVMMRANHNLPRFYNEDDWLVAAPAKDEKYLRESIIEWDARFQKWCYKYNQLFNLDHEWKGKIEDVKFDDPWRVMAQGALNRQLEELYTIYTQR